MSAKNAPVMTVNAVATLASVETSMKQFMASPRAGHRIHSHHPNTSLVECRKASATVRNQWFPSPIPPVTPEVVAKHGLMPEEFERIKKILGRAPNFTELGIFSVMWSEHCS